MSTDSPLVSCDGAARTYGTGSAATVALQPTDLEINAGDHVALVGQSGSGKSTLLHLMAGLDTPTQGSVAWPGIGTRDELRPGRSPSARTLPCRSSWTGCVTPTPASRPTRH